MPNSYPQLEEFISSQESEHTHITPPQVRELDRASRDLEFVDDMLPIQKVVLACGMCSVMLAECSPTYYGSAHITGFRGPGQ